MTKIYYRPWLLTALALLSFTRAQGGTTAQTDLASITVTPLTHQAGAKADWQTIYDYAEGAALPPGTRIVSEGKWIDPIVRKDQSGVTFSFPDLPDRPESAQLLRMAFACDRPLANYPTRITIRYTSFFNQVMPEGEWSPFLLATNITNYHNLALIGHLRVSSDTEGKKGEKHPGKNKPATSPDAMPLKPVGDNTLVVSLVGNGAFSVMMNGQDATAFFAGKKDEGDKLEAGAMLTNALALCNSMTQFPQNKGDWFTVNAFKVEQSRPPLEDSSAAAVDLTVPGSDPVRVTVEIVDAMNDSKGFLLRDTEVPPGKYRLYWDGIDQKALKPKDTAWIGAGSYTFRLTTGKITTHYAGEINNSTPPYNVKSYRVLNCTAVAMTPPGTVANTAQPTLWNAVNNPQDPRKMDAVDSVQLLTTSFDAALKGQWIGADGAVINTANITDLRMMHGRCLAITPPDPSDPANPEKQFYFASQNMHGGNAVVSCGFPLGKGNASPKTLTNPDWNRTKPGFVPYQIQLGQIPAALGPQHYLFFQTAPASKGEQLQADWVFRNVRLYEEGSPDPGPITFDPSQFSVRAIFKNKAPAGTPTTMVSEAAPPVPVDAKAARASPIPPGSVTVEDNGHAVHLKNAVPVNYPLNYNVTDKTILAFDLDVIDQSKVGGGNGIGLDPDPTGSKEDSTHYFHFLGGKSARDPKDGFNDATIGAYSYPAYDPNTLYTDSIPMPPPGLPPMPEAIFLWQPGFYGLKISEDGKFLFACNNADNRLEVRDISTDGHSVAKIPIDYPMFVTLAPEGAAGARQGMRYVYVDSPKAGLLRIAWNLSDNTFGKPETLTPASEFAYPRGLVYSTATRRIFVCDTFNLDRSKVANQIAVIDPTSGKIISRFGKQGGVDPATGGPIDDKTFTCPLTIDADSKGALWVNDYYSCELRKYNYDPASNGFTLERRVFGPENSATSQFYWLPDGPPTQVWTVGGFFVRDEADFGPDGRFINQRATSATEQLAKQALRPYAHFSKVGDHVYATFANVDEVYEKVGDGWAPRFAFGGSGAGKDEKTAEQAARDAGLLAKPGEPPTDLDKAIAASGDANWATRPWTWSDLNGDGKMEYSKDNPEFKIAFNCSFSILGHAGTNPATSFRADGAYVRPDNPKDGPSRIFVIPPKTVGGKVSYDWKDVKIIPCAQGEMITDVLAQDERYYVLRSSRSFEGNNNSSVECYDETGKLLWSREHNTIDLVSLQSLGEGMISIMDRGEHVIGPVTIRTKDGDLVTMVSCRENEDTWSHGALRTDADTGYIGLVQAYKVTGLSTVKSAAATVNLPKAGL